MKMLERAIDFEVSKHRIDRIEAKAVVKPALDCLPTCLRTIARPAHSAAHHGNGGSAPVICPVGETAGSREHTAPFAKFLARPRRQRSTRPT
jgi:hypothetical protein